MSCRFEAEQALGDPRGGEPRGGDPRGKGGTMVCALRAGCLERHGIEPGGWYRCGFEIAGTVKGCPRVRRAKEGAELALGDSG